MSSSPPHSLAIAKSSRSSLGTLDVLPIELIQKCTALLDLRPLGLFATTCRRAREIVWALPGLMKLCQRYPDIIASLDKTGVLEWHSFAALFDAISKPDCSTCGAAGTSFYLFTCRRYCDSCWRNEKEFCVLPMIYLQKAMDAAPAMAWNKIRPVIVCHQLPGESEIDIHESLCLTSSPKLGLAGYITRSTPPRHAGQLMFPNSTMESDLLLAAWREWLAQASQSTVDSGSAEAALEFVEALHKDINKNWETSLSLIQACLPW